MRRTARCNTTILGPNLTTAQPKLGTFHVHRAGCADIARKYNDPDPLTIAFTQPTDAADAVYGPGSSGFYVESGGDKAHGTLQNYLMECLTDFYFAPCLRVQTIRPKEAANMSAAGNQAEQEVHRNRSPGANCDRP